MKPTPILSIPESYKNAVRVRLQRHSKPHESGCVFWTGSLDRNGYGKFGLRHGDLQRMTGSHRAAWLAFEGDIPEGLEIDHLCRNAPCVNTAHMELVTGAVNTQRANHGNKKGRSGRPRRTGPYCETHGDSDVRQWARKDGYTARLCGICRRDYLREYNLNRKRKAA